MSAISIYQAHGFWARFYGWHSFHRQQQFLFFANCQAVHSFGLKQTLWVLFVNANGLPLTRWQMLRPNRVIWHPGSYGVIETASTCQKKRRSLFATLRQEGLTTTQDWVVDYLGQRCYEI